MLQSILDRRSVRRYTPEKVAPEQLRQLLECAVQAPSAMNRQSWQFVAVDDRATLNALADCHPYAAMLREAPLCVCVCGEEGAVPGYYQQDCAAATMNILIAAREMGLGSCWMGVAPRPERMNAVRKVLGIPEEIMPFNLIAVGHPAENPARPLRELDAKLHINRW